MYSERILFNRQPSESLFNEVSYQPETMSLKDELQAAVSARAIKTKTDHYSYSDDFDEDEDGEMADR